MDDFKVSLSFAGDWHGDTSWALNEVRYGGSGRLWFHLGDFGIWPGVSGPKYIRKVNAALVEKESFLILTLGNHEDYNRVGRLAPVSLDVFEVLRERFGFEPDFMGLTDPVFQYGLLASNIVVLPRPAVFNVGTVRFGSFGGAVSVDKHHRTPGSSWWAKEVPSFEETAAAFNMGEVDVLLTHDAPAGVEFYPPRSFPVSPDVDAESNSFSRVLRELSDRSKPRLLVHGHWHYFYVSTIHGVGFDLKDYESTVLGLSNECSFGNVATATVEGSVLTLDVPGSQGKITLVSKA